MSDNLSTKVKDGGFIPKNLLPGNNKIKINKVYLDSPPYDAKAYTVIVEAEGEEMETPFEGFDIDRDDPSKGKFKGQTGRIKSSNYAYNDAVVGKYTFDRDEQIIRFLNNLCGALGCQSWLEKEDGKHAKIESLVTKFNEDKPFKDIFFNACLAGREFENKGGYLSYDLFFPKFSKTDIPMEKLDTKNSRLTEYAAEVHIMKKVVKDVDGFGVNDSDVSAAEEAFSLED